MKTRTWFSLGGCKWKVVSCCAAGVPKCGHWAGYTGTSVYMHVMCIILERTLGYQVSIQF